VEIISVLGSIAFVVFAGWMARRFRILSTVDALGLNSYVYYIALPALFFVELAKLNLFQIDALIFIGTVAPILLLLAILTILYAFRVISKDNFVLLALAIVFGSNAFFGVTFFQAFRGQSGLDFAIVTASILGPIGIILTIALFELATGQARGAAYFKKIFLNPLILSIIFGALFSLLGINIKFLFKALEIIGKTAGPMAIFALGIFIFENFSLATLRKSIPYALFRLIALPAAAILVAYFLPVSQETHSLLVLQAGIPSAISLAVFAQRYNYKISELTDIVILTSFGGFLVIGLAYFFSTS